MSDAVKSHRALLVKRTERFTDQMSQLGFFDQMQIAASGWKVNAEAAAACDFLLVHRGDRVVDAQRILAVESVPARYDRDGDEAGNRKNLVTSVQIPEWLEAWLESDAAAFDFGQRNPCHYVTLVHDVATDEVRVVE